MKKLIIFAMVTVLAGSALAVAKPVPATATQDMVTMVKKGVHKTKRGTKVVYYRTKVGGKWVYRKGKAGTKYGYHRVKRGGIWVYEKAH